MVSCILTHTYTYHYAHMHIHTYIYIYIDTYAYIHIRTYLHIRTQTYTHTLSPPVSVTPCRAWLRTDRRTHRLWYCDAAMYSPCTWGCVCTCVCACLQALHYFSFITNCYYVSFLPQVYCLYCCLLIICTVDLPVLHDSIICLFLSLFVFFFVLICFFVFILTLPQFPDLTVI